MAHRSVPCPLISLLIFQMCGGRPLKYSLMFLLGIFMAGLYTYNGSVRNAGLLCCSCSFQNISGLSWRHVRRWVSPPPSNRVIPISRKVIRNFGSTSHVFHRIPDKELRFLCNRQRQIVLVMFYVYGSKNNSDVLYMVFIYSVSSVVLCCPALSNPSLYRGQKVTLFLPERLCCHANASSSGVWEVL